LLSSIDRSDDDLRLITAGGDGAVYVWDVESGKMLYEHTTKGCNHSCVAAMGDGNTVFVIGETMERNPFSELHMPSGKVTADVDCDAVLGQVCCCVTRFILLSAFYLFVFHLYHHYIFFCGGRLYILATTG
jgi:hypothetical protein